jgi:hypothetical protein
MYAPYILGCLGVVFTVLGAVRLLRERGRRPAARTWLLIGAIFLVASLWSSLWEWLAGPSGNG